jgi:hypothetical protein
LKLALKGTGKHVREQGKQEGQSQFHEWNDQDDDEGNQSEQITDGSLQLTIFTTSQHLTLQELLQETPGNGSFHSK